MKHSTIDKSKSYFDGISMQKKEYQFVISCMKKSTGWDSNHGSMMNFVHDVDVHMRSY